MAESYSQTKAMLAISKASLRAIFRSPSAVIFSFLFPLIFILVFGFIGGGSKISLRIAFDQHSDTSAILYHVLRDSVGFIIPDKSFQEIENDLQKGRLTAIIDIVPNRDTGFPKYFLHLKTSEAVNPQNINILKSILKSVIDRFDAISFPNRPSYATVDDRVESIPGRIYRSIDFILPGQLGFSLLSAGVFGVAFIFFSLRQTLVLKRFFATPIRRSYIVFGEGISRVIFQLITAIVILLIGHFAFHFTLVHGWVTFLELLVLSLIGLIVFMGFGFIVSGLARSENTIPPLANIVTLPQFLLAGTFFPIDNFPSWLQPLCNILPLTHLNDAMRNVAFEGAHLTDCGRQIGYLFIWGIVAYLAAIKVFRWE